MAFQNFIMACCLCSDAHLPSKMILYINNSFVLQRFLIRRKMAASDNRRRVKLYLLDEKKIWDDRGTGHVSSAYVEKLKGMSLLVRSETDGKYSNSTYQNFPYIITDYTIFVVFH